MLGASPEGGGVAGRGDNPYCAEFCAYGEMESSRKEQSTCYISPSVEFNIRSLLHVNKNNNEKKKKKMHMK